MIAKRVIAEISEKGGVGKTLTTVGLAAQYAQEGLRVGVIDLDPRATLTTWMGIEVENGYHVGAILGNENVEGQGAALAQQCVWNKNIYVIPSCRDLASLESVKIDFAEMRLKRSIQDWDVDIILIDVPNRQGGFLVISALAAATEILYIATPDQDGQDGINWSMVNVHKFRTLTPFNPDLKDTGIIISRWPTPIATKDAKRAVSEIDEDYPGLLLYPFIPERVIIKESRAAQTWWGNYPKGSPITEAFAEIIKKINK